MKKYIAFIVAAIIAFTVCVFPVSADSVGGGGQRYEQFAPSTAEYILSLFEVAKNAIQNGSITDGEISDVLNATNKWYDNTKKMVDDIADTALSQLRTDIKNAVEVLSVAPTRDDINNIVEMGRDLLNYCGIDYGKTETTENVIDMHGYGCVKYLDCTDSLGNRVICIGYGDYGIINSPNNLNSYLSNPVKINPGGTYWRFVSVNGSIVYDDFFSDPTSSYYPSYLSSFNGNYLYFGDWRYSDGTSADDKTTPNQNTIQTNDPSSLTDNQLIDLLEDILSNLKLDYPDLSTIEGLLSAILSQCKSINGKIDGLSVSSGSVNYEQLQSCIDTAILTLSASNADNSAAIVNELIKLREAITGEIYTDDGSNWFDNLFGGLFNKSTSDDGTETMDINEAAVEDCINNLGAILVDDNSGEVLGIVSVGDVTKLGKSGVVALSSLVDLIIDFNKTLPSVLYN